MKFNKKDYQFPISIPEMSEMLAAVGIRITPKDIIIIMHDEGLVEPRAYKLDMSFHWFPKGFTSTDILEAGDCSNYRCLHITEETFWYLYGLIPQVRVCPTHLKRIPKPPAPACYIRMR